MQSPCCHLYPLYLLTLSRNVIGYGKMFWAKKQPANTRKPRNVLSRYPIDPRFFVAVEAAAQG
jgi:hypothetical protein